MARTASSDTEVVDEEGEYLGSVTVGATGKDGDHDVSTWTVMQ